MKALAALAIVVAGAVAAFAVYTAGREDESGERAAPCARGYSRFGRATSFAFP